MNKEQICIAIAEACGWCKYGDMYYSHEDGKEVQWWIKDGMCDAVHELPDYLITA